MTVYSCRNMPTVQQFFDSDAFVRGLMGPFGCLTGDTEFLSRLGWKRMDAYQDGDEVAGWDQSGYASWVRPSQFIDEPCDEMLLFDSGGLKMALSPEHRVPHWNYVGDFQVSSAAEIARTTTRKEIPTTFHAPANFGLPLTDDMIRFSVMMQADGHYVAAGRQAMVTVRKERKKARVRQILAAAGIEWDERVYDGRLTETRFVFYPPHHCKRFGPEWYAATRAQLVVILDEIQHWDGLHGYSERRYFSTDKASADFVQYASHATGRRAVLREKIYEQDGWKPGYTVYLRTSASHKNKASIREHTAISLLAPPNGRKYCFTVPTGFFVARYRDTVFITGNSGKSSAATIEIGQRGLQVPPFRDGVRRSRFAVIRNTAKQLEDTTERTFLQWFPPITYGDWVPSKHNYTIRALRAEGDDRNAEIEVMFRALDREDQLGDLLSMELTGAFINEAREVPWAVVDGVQGRLGRYPPRGEVGRYWYGMWMDTNPPDVDTPWYKFFEETDHTDLVAELAKIVPGLTVDGYRSIFKQPSGTSPLAENLEHLPEGYYQRLAIGKSQEWIKVYIDGRYGFIIDGKAVWPEYNDQMHCPTDKAKFPHPIEGQRIIRSWDCTGLNPACIFSQITPRGQWIVFDEMVGTSMGADAFSDDVIEHSAREYPRTKYDFLDVGDPAGQSKNPTDMRSYFQVIQSKGIPIEPAIQTLTIRLESVRKPLRTLVDGRPQFVLHPRCAQLRRALMGGYHYRRIRVSGERYSAEPEKNLYSNPADALQYGATRLFGAGLMLPQQDSYRSSFGRSDDSTRSNITGY